MTKEVSRNNSLKSKTILLASSCLLALGAFNPSVAQETEPAVTSIADIVVTAQRRTERLEEVPQAVVALTTEVLDQANVVNIHELGRIAPGVQINFGGLSSQPSIRGVSSLTNGTGNENNVAVYVDGFYVPDNTSINSDLANLESIQVLKGPQGTLYGRNATGGAILVNTIRPTDHLKGKIDAAYGSFNDRRVSGYVSGPLTDNVRLLVAGAVRESDGHIKMTDPFDVNRTDGPAAPVQQRALRTKLEWDVTPDLRATFAYNYAFSSDATGVLFTTFAYQPATLPAGNNRANRFGTASYNHDSTTSTETHEGTMKLEWTTPLGVLTSYTGYADRHHEVDFDFDGTYVDSVYGITPTDQKTFQQAFDLVIDRVDRLNLVLGGFYLKDEISQKPGVGQVTIVGGGSYIERVYRPMETKAYAVYADATFDLTERLVVGVGGRYSHDERSVSQLITMGNGTPIVPYYEDEADWSAFTPRATIRYELAPRTNVYASYSRGFRSGSFNSAQVRSEALNLPIEPEEIDAYELGFKTARNNLRFEIAAFYYEYENLNVSLTVPNPSCAGLPTCNAITVVGNAPEATVKGVDAQLVYSPIDRLNLSIGGAYLKARYGEFANAIGVGISANGLTNVTGQAQDWSGQQMARAPDLTLQVSADYSLPLMGGDLKLASNLVYSDSYVISNPSLYGPLAPAALRDQQRFRQDETTLVNVDATWTDASGQYSVAVYAKNLFDEDYRQTYNGGANGDYSAKAAPANYGVRLGYRF